MADPETRLKACFAAVFPELSEEETPRASQASFGKWDSLATITLVGVVEEEFGLSVGPDDVEQFVSYKLILDYLRSRNVDP